jgi:hypothetical protein
MWTLLLAVAFIVVLLDYLVFRADARRVEEQWRVALFERDEKISRLKRRLRRSLAE